MNELIKNRLAFEGIIDKIQNLFIIREVNDRKINELKTYIEYYEQLKKEWDILIKNHEIGSDPETEKILNMFLKGGNKWN